MMLSSLSIGRLDGNNERAPEVVNFLTKPSQDTFGPFFGWMFGVVIITGPGAFLGLVAWSLAELRSGKILATAGLFVLLFALVFNLLP